MVAKRDWAGCTHTLKTYSRLVALAALPITAGIVLFARPLVRILFERGAFTPADTKVVGGVLALYAIQIPFYLMGMLLVRFLSSLKRNDVLMYGSAINLILDIILNLVFMKFFGIAGIALSTSAVYVASFLYLSLWVVKLIRQETGRKSVLAEAKS